MSQERYSLTKRILDIGDLSDSASGLDPIQRPKADVQEDQAWLQFLRLLNCF